MVQLPETFATSMRALLGEAEFDAYLKSFEEEWKPGLRLNALKGTNEKLLSLLPWDLQPVPWCDRGFYCEGESRPSLHPAYYAGLYYLQEPSAMTPGQLLPIKPGDRVLDLCAAPGGKSTQLAARLNGTGVLFANDVSASRAMALLKNLELFGVKNAFVSAGEPERIAQELPGYFDAVLVDAPCSGEGMFRKEPSMVASWQERGPSYYAPIQRRILGEAVKLVRPGGHILYSTCTFSREEDEETVEAVLEMNPEVELVKLPKEVVSGSVDGFGLSGCLRLFPHRLRGEGHFLALLRKKGEAESNEPLGNAKSKKDRFVPEKADVAATEAFLKTLKIHWTKEQLLFRPEGVYLIPESVKTLPNLRFLRTGLLLGTAKKGRFEPSQALAMALRADEYEQCVHFSMQDERVTRYLKGETIALTPEEGARKDWQLVCVEEYPLGWAKGTGMSLKNKYYPGWRMG